MERIQSGEQLKDEYTSYMGEELGSVFHALWNEVAWLHLKWAEYEELYGKSQERVDLLNEVSPQFFRIVQDSLGDEILLHIARITDPPTDRKSNNLTIRRLSSEFGGPVDDNSIDIAIEATVFCRNRRNKMIAHRDLAYALTGQCARLDRATCAQVNGALDSISELLNKVLGHYVDKEICFRGIAPHGATALVYALSKRLHQ